MFFLTPILAGIMIAGTFGAGAYLEDQAKTVVFQYNVNVISQALQIYYLDYGRYPFKLKQLDELRNLNDGEYSYEVAIDGSAAKVCGRFLSNCWSSSK